MNPERGGVLSKREGSKSATRKVVSLARHLRDALGLIKFSRDVDFGVHSPA